MSLLVITDELKKEIRQAIYNIENDLKSIDSVDFNTYIGEVMVLTEIGGTEILKAPCSMISKPGKKRALYAITDLVWTTIHHNPTNTQDLKKLEKIVIAKDYKEYDRFILSEKGVVNKIKNKIIKILSL